ncbi:MAG: hypothetical protein LQ350_000249 [Teloschistes chrysophthalmus]|nr:MAG: hypothetical protein LQ350_000249 [Niorma chrysophthalma]
MAPYLPLYVIRSDGKLEVLTKLRKKELNAPSDDQLNKKPDAKGNVDYFKEVEVGDTKEVDWRRKLGGMLIREIGGQENAGANYILAALPENYRLYDRVTVKSGGSETADAYLYGHPQGRKKRYRSPGDFFPHLLWLATDEHGDTENCSCKFCAPDDIQVFEKPDKMRAPEPVKKEPSPVKKDSAPPKPPATGTKPMVVVPGRSNSQDANASGARAPSKLPSTGAAIPSAIARQTAPQQLVPTQLAPAKCFEQDQDAQYNKYIFRPGELVWFNRGNAWGLSIILKRTLTRDVHNNDRARYLVQPISHPFHNPPTKIIESEDGLRPWLAWSPPLPTHHGLATTGLTYNNIDWKSVCAGRYGQGDAEVDGSIFAAKAVDDSFTLFDQLANNTVTTGERIYNGIYLGGEKIWTGEPVRLRKDSGQDIMVVHSIVERLKPGSTSTASASVFLVGDVYRFGTSQLQPGLEPPDNRHLPIRLRQDLEYRNRATIQTRRTVSFWKIIQAQAAVSITDVKGRWYESSTLLPVLKGTLEYSKELQLGKVDDVGGYLNARGDCNCSTHGAATTAAAVVVPYRMGTRVVERLEAFGKSIPVGTRVSKGLDGPPEDQMFPSQVELAAAATAAGAVGVGEQGVEEEVGVGVGGKKPEGVSDGDIAQFMDLDRMEEGYEQQYVEAGGHY